MPCLNSDLHLNIVKKLIEKGSSKDVFKFALSGKEQFKATTKIFASVTTLELYDDRFAVGWEDCTYEFGIENSLSLLFMKNIGESVIKLHIARSNETYRTIIYQIIERKQLTTLSIGPFCDSRFLEEFIPFLSTLKNNV